MYYLIKPTDKDLQHYGVKGMEWGVRKMTKVDDDKKTTSKLTSISSGSNTKKKLTLVNNSSTKSTPKMTQVESKDTTKKMTPVNNRNKSSSKGLELVSTESSGGHHILSSITISSATSTKAYQSGQKLLTQILNKNRR